MNQNAGVTPAPASSAPPPAPIPAAADRTRGHSPAQDQREHAGAGPARKLSVGGAEYDEQSVVEAMAERAERAIKKQGLPQDPSGYEVKLPADFVLPHGMEFKFCAEDAPGIAQVRQFALAHGLDQPAFEQLLSIHAANTLAGESARREFARTEEQKLGSLGNQRLADAHTWLKSMAGDEGAAALMVGVVTARQVEAIEALQRRFSAQGGTTFTQSGRDHEDPNTVSEETWNSWTFSEKRAWQDSLKRKPNR